MFVGTGCYSGQGFTYAGTLSTTPTGYACESWTGYGHTYNSSRFPESSVELAKNYCRNPSEGYKTWCFSTNSGFRYEYCEVPKCGKCVKEM